MTISRILTYLFLACIALAAVSATQDGHYEGSFGSESETWQDFGRLAALIHALPAWNEQDDLKAEEWKSLADLAVAFQGLRDSEVETALITYMNLYRAQDDKTHSGRTKPLLLLRMMYDTSKRTKYATDRHGLEWHERGYQPCGGFDWTETSISTIWELDELPIAWSDGKPALRVKRVTGPVNQVGGTPKHSYQPHLEFRYLRDMYEKRDLSALASAKKIKWRDLAKAANLFADDRG